MSQCRIFFHKLANFVAIPYRHKHIGEHQIRLHIGNFAHRGLAVAHGHNLDALVFQRQTHHLLNVAVVVRHQDLGHRTSSGSISRYANWKVSRHDPRQGLASDGKHAPWL